MKAERSYPVFAVTPKAEAAIHRGHPWVYAEEITGRPRECGKRHSGGRGQQKGPVSWHRVFIPALQDPRAPYQP